MRERLAVAGATTRPRSSPTGPTRPRSTRALKQIAGAAAAGVRRRGPRPHRRARPRSPTGEAFLLQAGDCAESFDDFSRRRHPRQAAGHPADGGRAHLLVGRARREGRPHRRPVRQAPLGAHRDASATSSCPSFRGHMVNDIALHRRGPRRPTPSGSSQAYHQSASTLNLLRAFTKGGFADLSRVARLEPGVRRRRAARASATSRSPTRSTGRCASWRPAASTLDAEPPAPRGRLLHEPRGADPRLRGGAHPPATRSPATGTTARPTCSGSASAPASSTAPTSSSCAASATRSAASSARRPRPTRCSRCASALNPERVPGPAHARSPAWAPSTSSDGLPPLLAAVRDAGHPVVWACDPMHGNTFTAPAGRKTRHFDDILAEIAGFFARPPRRGHLAGRRARRAHRRRRHRVPGRRRGDPRRPTSTTATRRCATRG